MASPSMKLILGAKDETRQAFASVQQRTTSLSSMLKRTALGLGAYFSARAIAGGLSEAINLASDAEETAGKFGAVFGGAADQAEQSLNNFARTAGRSREELKATASDFQALIKPMGVAEGEAAKMSTSLTQLTSDLASFFNTSDDQAATALRAGLVGESEPLRKYGVQLSAARIEQEVFARGMASTKDEITSSMKAQSAFNIILADTTQAQGDAIRTSDGLANTKRKLSGAVLDLKTQLGDALLPTVTSITSALADTVAKTSEVVHSFGGAGEAAVTFGLGVKVGALEGAVAMSQFADSAFDALGAVGDVVRAVSDNMFGAFKTAFSNIGIMARNLFDDEIRSNILSNLWTAIKNTLSNVWTGVKNLATNIRDIFAAMFEAIKTRSLDPFRDLVLTSITDGMKDVGKHIDSAVIDLTKGTTTFKPIPITFSADPQKSALTEFLEQSLARARDQLGAALNLPGGLAPSGGSQGPAGSSGGDSPAGGSATTRGGASGPAAAVEARFLTGVGESARIQQQQLAEQRTQNKKTEELTRRVDSIFGYLSDNRLSLVPSNLRR